MIQAVLSNGQRPEYGTVTVSFPISREEYDCVMEQLASLEIGDPSKQDCIVNKIDGFFIQIIGKIRHPRICYEKIDFSVKVRHFGHAAGAKF